MRQRIAVAFADRELRLLIAGTFLSAMLTTQMYSTFAIYMTDYVGVTKAEVGLLYTLNGGMVLALQMPAMTLIRSRGIRAILPWASLLSTVGFALIALASLPGAALAIFVITCAEMLFAPAHQATIAELAAPGARGRMFGVVGFAQLLGIALAPLTGGLLLDAIGQHSVALWLSLATLGLGQTFCLWRFARCPRTTGVTAP
ncbi:MAG: MFS transporter [Myxococcales bacterium]|nr:MFS transporter [Myxococcales bacterium]